MGTRPKKIGMTPPHPGEFISDEIFSELKLNVGPAAKILDVQRAALSDLANGNAALSREMALRIEKAFGVDMDMLLQMQGWHDARVIRRRAGEIHVRRYKPSATHPR
jgi:antitoxin HigA-1